MQAGVFIQLWYEALPDDDDLIGLNFAWMALDGTLHQAPLGGKKTGLNPTDRGNSGVKRSLLTEVRGIPVGLLEGANRSEMKRTASTLRSLPPAAQAARDAYRAVGHDQHVCLDTGYDYDHVRAVVSALGYTGFLFQKDDFTH